MERHPAIPIITMGGNMPNLHAEQLLHTPILPDYPETRRDGFAYVISLQGMTDEAVEALKTDVCIKMFQRG